jgi:hybrid cluster-associated redox disulfide protein
MKTTKVKNVNTKEKITKNMVLGDVIANYPGTIEVFFKHGLPCASCQMASGETVEDAAVGHGVNLEKLMKDLNKAAKK